jgi:hypothetical protein
MPKKPSYFEASSSMRADIATCSVWSTSALIEVNTTA